MRGSLSASARHRLLCNKIKRLVSSPFHLSSRRQQGGNVFFSLHKRLQGVHLSRRRRREECVCACDDATETLARSFALWLARWARIKFDIQRQAGGVRCVCLSVRHNARESVVKFNCFKANITMSKKKTQSAAARQLHIGLTRQRDKHTLGHVSFAVKWENSIPLYAN